MDFGAVGDGVTNDYPAIQSAVNHLQSTGGGALFFPFGQYRVDTTVAIPWSNINLYGDGATIVNGSINSP